MGALSKHIYRTKRQYDLNKMVESKKRWTFANEVRESGSYAIADNCYSITMSNSQYFYWDGEQPKCVDAFDCFHEIFCELSTNDDIIHDLSLPPQEYLNKNFRCTMERIAVRYHRVAGNRSVKTSKTHYADVNDLSARFDAYIHLYYSEYEETNCPNLIRARVTHEGSHAIRAVMVLLSKKEGVDANCLLIRTPKMERHAMRNKTISEAEPVLYKMTKSDFHSGYYMEHVIYGGIWVKLSGYILDEQDNMILMQNPEEFRITCETGEIKMIFSKKEVAVDFTALIGVWGNSVEVAKIYYNGPIDTRGSSQDR